MTDAALDAMKPFAPCPYDDQASSYALGELHGVERALFEKHVQGCTACQEALELIGETMVDLSTLIAAEPPPSLRDKLLFKIGQTAQAPGQLLDEDGILAVRPEEISWKPLFPGIEFKTLYTDRPNKTKTIMVRMEPGAKLPKHRHKDVEELFVLSGDLRVDGTILQAGDYCRAETESVHDEATTMLGCTFLCMASQHNEFLK